MYLVGDEETKKSRTRQKPHGTETEGGRGGVGRGELRALPTSTSKFPFSLSITALSLSPWYVKASRAETLLPPGISYSHKSDAFEFHIIYWVAELSCYEKCYFTV